MLTRLPVPRLQDFGTGTIERGAKYFPLVGAVVGAVCAVVFWAGSMLWTGMLPAIVAVAVGVALTGAFHEDGLADFFDALGGATPAARLTIMKDSHLGTYGVLALVFTSLAKCSALATLSPGVGCFALIAAHSGGRFVTVAVISLFSYAGDVGAAKVKPLQSSAAHQGLMIATAFGLLPVLALPLRAGVPGALAGILVASWASLSARRLLGGYTGDVLGAVEQSYEVAFLISIAACA